MCRGIMRPGLTWGANYRSSECHIGRVDPYFHSTIRNHLLNWIEVKIRRVVCQFRWHIPNCWEISSTRGKHLFGIKIVDVEVEPGIYSS
ncbi:hypothetical protein V6N11_055570 [Hibiscus sabdariffa]|uniref:Uncharacterized protein n=1 Tax=Hibiscus sabdariffa TaxID=183260 RepID=A0ABR2NQX5_9ROSI